MMDALRRKRIGDAVRKHGRAGSIEYTAWTRMKKRCLNPASPDYPAYGGRGITVCQEWRDTFEAFYRDMGPKPCRGTSLDRIDNERGYEPGNCRWATPTEQANNRRSSRKVEVGGVIRTIAQWAAATGISEDVIQQRLGKLGWSPKRAVSTPTRRAS